MDFFARQDQARRNTKLLVFYFCAAVGVIVGSVYLVLAGLFLRPKRDPLASLEWLWNPPWMGWVALGTLAVIALGSLFKILELSRGGAAVATALGGRPVSPQTTDPDERKLLNVVEEMAIASGVPVPDVYLLEREQGINAFAAGFKPGDAVIGVTRGCVRMLTRDELQGVMAHEFSHILNGDMRLNLRLIGWLNGILCLALLGYYLMRISFYSGGGSSSSGGGGKKGGNPLPLIGLALLVIGWTGVFFGRLIKSAVSRQREFLADAAAVQFTRNPDGLVSALKKIGGASQGSRIQAAAAEEASHLFFGNGLKPPLFSGLFATHPPLARRIQVWEPSFDGRYSAVQADRPAPQPAPAPAGRKEGQERLMGLAGAAAALSVSAGNAMQNAGEPTFAHLALAGELMAALSDRIRAATREPFGATALVHGMLCAKGGETAEAAAKLLPPPVWQEVERLLPELRALPPRTRLPLLEMSLPALRELSPAQFDQFDAAVRGLVEADSEIDLFEYAALKLLARHLTPHFRKPAKQRTAQYYSLQPLLNECAVLLSALAHVGNEEDAAADQAYQAGISRLGLTGAAPALQPFGSANLPQVDQALDQLALTALPLKRKLLDACAHAVAADGTLGEREAELLRAIADALGCPVPPFLRAG
ncbi:MAG: M48 family metalloprotease [Verrucomicrobiales bacterium]|nr:M48 family metalloprotease [Verrucomicrobiales bacterium]